MEQVDALISASRIPDTIKLIPTYGGDRKGLTAWLSIVDTTLALYEALSNTDLYGVWVQQIRNKIIGEAMKALEGGRANMTWPEIKRSLTDYFGDKRELSTLTQEIPYLRQGNKSLHEYYHSCGNLLNTIEDKIRLDPLNEGHEDAIMRVLSEQVKNGFIDGLNDPYDKYTRNYRPATLLDAYQCAQQQVAAEERKTFKRFQPKPKPLQQQQQQYQNQPQRQPQYRPNTQQTAPNRTNAQSGQFRTNGYNNQNYNNRPTPMEVDQSIRSRQTFKAKRPGSDFHANMASNQPQEVLENVLEEESEEQEECAEVNFQALFRPSPRKWR